MRLNLFLEIDLSHARANLSHTDVAQRFDLNIFLLQHKAIGIGHKFNNLDRPLPYTNTLYIEIYAFIRITVN